MFRFGLASVRRSPLVHGAFGRPRAGNAAADENVTLLRISAAVLSAVATLDTDLNARNVLLSEEHVYLVDFDRCRLRAPGMWRDANLVRLRRSLEKITWALPAERFAEADWHGLLDGYRRAAGKAEPAAA